MRKLTVKNFSVIKEAELEFGKITVLIGPQASGKSLLCKLAYFLSKEVVDIAVDRIMSRFDFAAFENEVKKKFAEWFPRGGWRASDWWRAWVRRKMATFVFEGIKRVCWMRFWRRNRKFRAMKRFCECGNS